MLLAWLAVLTDARAQVLVPDKAIEFEYDTARTMAGEVETYLLARPAADQDPKPRALREAKKQLREGKDERGAPNYTTRDWAAWVLTGDPD